MDHVQKTTAREAAAALGVEPADVTFGTLLVPAETRAHLAQHPGTVIAPDEIDPKALEADDVVAVTQLATTNLHRGIDLQGGGHLLPVWSAPNNGRTWGYALVAAGEVTDHAEWVGETLTQLLDETLETSDPARLEIGPAIREAAAELGNPGLTGRIDLVDTAARAVRDEARSALEKVLQKENLGLFGSVPIDRLLELPEPEMLAALTLLRRSSTGDLTEALGEVAGNDPGTTRIKVASALEWSRWELETLETITRITSRLQEPGELLGTVVDEPAKVCLEWEKWTHRANTPELHVPTNLAAVGLDELVSGTPALDELTGTDPEAVVAGALRRSQKDGTDPSSTEVRRAFERLSTPWRALLVRADTSHWMVTYLKSS